jgi:putative membrane protein
MMMWTGWSDWMSGWSDGRSGWHFAGHVVWYAFLIALAAGLTVFLIRRLSASQGGMSALDILKARYARGEISKADFDSMRRDIMA